MKDTSERAEARMGELVRALAPSERLAMACRMFDAARELVRAGVMAEHGPVAEADMRQHYLLRFYGQDLSERTLTRILAAWGKAGP